MMMEQRSRGEAGLGGYSFSRRVSGWGKSRPRKGFETTTPATPPPPPPAYFCAMQKSSGSCGTSSPSPRVRGAQPAPDRVASSSPPPRDDYDWEASRPEQPPRHSEVVISSDGGDSTSIASSSQQELVQSVSESSSTARPQQPRRVVWAEFDAPSLARGGRELARRKCTFKIFVVFRGGWCTSSHALLKGFAELNPDIMRAGGKVVGLSSQTPQQVGLVARDLKLPFQAFGDPTNGLVEEMNIRFKMDCTVSRNAMVTDAYPHGMAQPCVLAVFSDEAQDEDSVLYTWNRWQTIASMRHADAWAQITRALSSKATPVRLPESGGNDLAGGGLAVPPPTAAQRTTRLPPRPSMPYRPEARAAAASPTSSSFMSGGYAPFAGHHIGATSTDAAAVAAAAASHTPRATAAAVAAAEEGGGGGATPRVHRAALTLDDTVGGALLMGWMRTGVDPAVFTPRGGAAADAGDGMDDRSSGSVFDEQAPRTQAEAFSRVSGSSSRLKTRRGDGDTGENYGGAGDFFAEEGEAAAAAAAGGRGGSVFESKNSSSSADSRAREERAARFVAGPKEKDERRRTYPATPLRPPRSKDSDCSRIGSGSQQPVRPVDDLPTYTQAEAAAAAAATAAAAAAATAPTAVLPPKHRRRPSQATNEGDCYSRPRYGTDVGIGGKSPQNQQQNQQNQQKKGGSEARSPRRFWFGSNSRNRRTSFDEAASDFNNGGDGGSGGGSGGGSSGGVESRRATASGRIFPYSPGGGGAR